MKILIIGDIYGVAGKYIINKHLPVLKKKFNPDFIIANGENVSMGGKSLIKSDYDELVSYGIDYFTMGNHTFKNKEINDYIDNVNNLVRPANWYNKVKGQGYITFTVKGKKILLLNLLGMAFMNIKVNNPFHIADEILSKNNYDLAIVDFHAEATSEKIVLGNYLSNKVGIFYGTHTHVQTSDERIINNKTAYITDVGMTGVLHSAIGADLDAVTKRMKSNIFLPFKEAKGNELVFCAILIKLSPNDLTPISIERIRDIIKVKK